MREGILIPDIQSGLADIRFIGEIQIFEIAYRFEKRIFTDYRAERIFGAIFFHELKRHLIHVVHRQKAQSRGGPDGVCGFVGVCLAHGRRAVQKNLHVHLPLVGKQLDKILLEPAVKIPVDTPYVVAEHVFSIIRKLHGLTVRAYKMLAAEKARQVGAKIQCKRFKPTEEVVVQ